MKPIETKKKYDVIFIGNIAEEKRPLNILDLKGKFHWCSGHKNIVVLLFRERKNTTK